MGKPTIPDPAMVVVAVIHADPSALESAVERLNSALGPVRRAGEPFPFRWTDYYSDEMGPDLTRCFLAGERLVERQWIVELKHLCNRIERELSRRDGSRRINLDPGLLSMENFVLASTKNFAHRIYLREGIFAEVTLKYVRGSFEPLPWTFPDYRSVEVQSVLADLRDRYVGLVRSPAREVVREVKP